MSGPDKKAALWNALTRLAQSPPKDRTILGLKTLVQDKDIKDALGPYTVDGPYGRLLDAESDTLGYGRWQVFEMHELTKSYPTAVMPVLTYLFHRLDQRFGKGPTLLVLDEGWLFLDDPVFAPKIREWLKTLRKKKVLRRIRQPKPGGPGRQPHLGNHQGVLFHQDLFAQRHGNG